MGLLASLSLGGCSTAKYLLQAGKGQLALSNRARPIPEVIDDERTPPRIRALLAEIVGVKAFGESYGLKPTSNYQDYVQLDRSAAVYVVSACQELEFKPVQWTFPIVGSFPYLGWFDLKDAKEYGAGLKSKGYDVDVRGARAYSTLGWFRDSVLSSMIPDGQEALGELVNVVIHESLHATLYVNNQSVFNESLASFVADRLAPIYLEAKVGKESIEYAEYMKSMEEEERRQLKLHKAYQALDRLYASTKSAEQKREEKARLIGVVRKELGITRELNNASLIQFKTYETSTAEFSAVLQACGGSWPRFLKQVAKVKFERNQEQSIARPLLQLAREGCST